MFYNAIPLPLPICLFFRPSWEFFHSYRDVTITGEGMHILTCARHSWPLGFGSLSCHTYCDTGYSLIMVISEHPWYPHLLLSVKQWSCHYQFLCLLDNAQETRRFVENIHQLYTFHNKILSQVEMGRVGVEIYNFMCFPWNLVIW